MNRALPRRGRGLASPVDEHYYPTSMATRRTANVEVARITARQAIVVALITTIGGIAAGVIANREFTRRNSFAAQRWLRIDGVRSTQPSDVRLIISVNGYNYSYPSTSVWVRPGAYTPRERFALPPAEVFRVSFSVLLDDEPLGFEHGSPVVNEHSAVPTATPQTYRISTQVVRGGKAEDVEINYTIE